MMESLTGFETDSSFPFSKKENMEFLRRGLSIGIVIIYDDADSSRRQMIGNFIKRSIGR